MGKQMPGLPGRPVSFGWVSFRGTGAKSMSRTRMSDPNVDRWRQLGTLYLLQTKHPRMCEWAMMADDPACDAMLDLLNRMKSARWPSKRTLSAVKPTRPPDHGGDYAFRGATEFTIIYRKGTVANDHWLLEERDRGIVLSVGLSRLHELRDAITDMKRGGGDFAIGGDKGRLWIWAYMQQPPDNG
jgi:hypothetical protein